MLASLASQFAAVRAEADGYRERAEAAQRRLESYESFESSLRESVTAALTRVQEEMASRLGNLRAGLDALEAERFPLVRELERLRQERSALEATIAMLRPEASALRELAAQMLRAVLTETMTKASSPGSRGDEREAPVAAVTAPIAPRADVVEDIEASASPGPASSELRLVLSPIRSMSQLVMIENHIQSMTGVSGLYMYRSDTESAMLRVTLSQDTSPDEFVENLQGSLTRPRMQVDSVADREFHIRVFDEPAVSTTE